ncbi:hypothetical protein NTR1_32 [Nocardia phage NTR1]|nr:hypothetical protein NTR1_32 [Nocardia phage NTR1]
MMYPKSNEAALLEQLEAERAISDLVEIALELWLPLAERAVLQAATEPPPDPTAAADAEEQWNYLVDALVLYGIGVIAADAYDKAYTVLTGVQLAAGRAVLPLLRFDMPGMPTRSELRLRVSAVLSRRIGIDAEAVEARTRTVPQLQEFVNSHVGNIRGRIMDAVGRVFRRVRRVTDEAPPEQAREDVEPVFDADDGEWERAADTVGQTHAGSTLNAATTEAARQASTDTGRRMEVEWVAIIDTHTRLAHEQADGQRQPLGSPFTVGGEQLQFPGDPMGSIDNTVNCRCRLFAYFTEPDPGLRAAGTSPVSEKVATMTTYRSFEAVLAVIGTPTDDGRMFASDIDLTFRDFPLPLLWQKQSAGGHYDAFTVAVIQSAGVVGTEVIGKGYLLNTPEADEAAMQIEHGVTGPSVDLGDVEWELRDTNGNPISEDDWWDNPDMEVVSVVLSAKVLAATLVATPAFGQTSIKLGEPVEIEEGVVAALVASAVPARPAKPHAAAFADPGFTEPTYPHQDENGIIKGHLAAWNVCHTGIADSCVIAPRSQTDYAWFHTSPPVELADGGKVKVGRLTVGGGHAGPRMGPGPAIAHYDNVGTCFALVHVGEDEHGIWFSGIPAPGATEEQIAQGLAAPLSGDWRAVGGNLELVAALAVNTPGFPLLASGATDDDDMPLALVASLGPCPGDAPKFARGGRVSEADQVSLARHIVSEWRAAERREADAKALIAGEVRRQASALIEKVD